MYPLNMTHKGLGGYAVANDDGEHQRLSDMGYEPKFEAPEADPSEADGAGHTVASVRAQLDAAGIPYDKRLGLSKLLVLLPA